MVGSEFENACSKSGVSLPLQIGGQELPFITILQLNGNFNGLYISERNMIYISM